MDSAGLIKDSFSGFVAAVESDTQTKLTEEQKDKIEFVYLSGMVDGLWLKAPKQELARAIKARLQEMGVL